jgi:hypothetical protein
VADALFQELVTFGRLASAQPLQPEQLRAYAEGRAGFTLSFIDVCQKVAGVGFSAGAKVPYCYNKGDWPASAGVAGYAHDATAVGPAEVANALFLNWNLQTTNQHLMPIRLMRCALWRMSSHGLVAGLELLLDLYEWGHCSVGALFNALDALLMGCAACQSVEELVSRFFDGTPPESVGEFIEAELEIAWIGDNSDWTPLQKAALEEITLRSSESITAARHSVSLNEWYVYQVQIGGLLGAVLNLQAKYAPNPGMGLKVIMSQWEEVKADAIGFQLSCRAKYAFPSIANIAAYGLGAVGASYRSRTPGDWRDRLFAERLVIPSELRRSLLDGNQEPVSPDWERLPPAAIGPWLQLFRDGRDPSDALKQHHQLAKSAASAARDETLFALLEVLAGPAAVAVIFVKVLEALKNADEKQEQAKKDLAQSKQIENARLKPDPNNIINSMFVLEKQLTKQDESIKEMFNSTLELAQELGKTAAKVA